MRVRNLIAYEHINDKLKEILTTLKIIEEETLYDLDHEKNKIKKKLTLNELIKNSKLIYKLRQLIKAFIEVPNFEKEIEKKKKEYEEIKKLEKSLLKDNNKIVALLCSYFSCREDELIAQIELKKAALEIYK